MYRKIIQKFSLDNLASGHAKNRIKSLNTIAKKRIERPSSNSSSEKSEDDVANYALAKEREQKEKEEKKKLDKLKEIKLEDINITAQKPQHKADQIKTPQFL
jgi:hypothetical protein